MIQRDQQGTVSEELRRAIRNLTKEYLKKGPGKIEIEYNNESINIVLSDFLSKTEEAIWAIDDEKAKQAIMSVRAIAFETHRNEIAKVISNILGFQGVCTKRKITKDGKSIRFVIEKK